VNRFLDLLAEIWFPRLHRELLAQHGREQSCAPSLSEKKSIQELLK
jgi:hypothetical protein